MTHSAIWGLPHRHQRCTFNLLNGHLRMGTIRGTEQDIRILVMPVCSPMIRSGRVKLYKPKLWENCILGNFEPPYNRGRIPDFLRYVVDTKSRLFYTSPMYLYSRVLFLETVDDFLLGFHRHQHENCVLAWTSRPLDRPHPVSTPTQGSLGNVKFTSGAVCTPSPNTLVSLRFCNCYPGLRKEDITLRDLERSMRAKIAGFRHRTCPR
jgi:hypothetical protein